jgi:hypothetical protein
MAKIQPKSQVMFQKNGLPRDLYNDFAPKKEALCALAFLKTATKFGTLSFELVSNF